MKELIKKLVEAYGPSGREESVRALITELIHPHVDELRTDALGNLIALRKGSALPGGRRGRRVMIAAHMDELGVIITHVDKKGFLRFNTIGGVFMPTLVGSRVVFANGAVGVIGWEKWLKGGDHHPAMQELFIDVGATSPADAPVGVGDVACFMRSFSDLGARLTSKAMDDRIGCAVGVQALLELKDSPHEVYLVFTTQEEVGVRGALVSAYGIEPEVGLALDVTDTGDTPEATPMAVELGGGPAIKVMDSGAITHPAVKAWMIETAVRLELRYQLEVLPFGGTDAMAIQRSRAGIPAGCLSVPCRYIHTPSEMVDYTDVQGAVRLLVGLLSAEITF